MITHLSTYGAPVRVGSRAEILEGLLRAVAPSGNFPYAELHVVQGGHHPGLLPGADRVAQLVRPFLRRHWGDQASSVPIATGRRKS
jgi:hypothetical protein